MPRSPSTRRGHSDAVTIRRFLHQIVWGVNAIRRRDPMSTTTFARVFGARHRRAWDPSTTPRRVVIVRSDEIGDTVGTLTLLAAMRAQWPKATIHLVAKPGPATIFHATRTIDRLIPWYPITEGSALRRQVLTARQAVRRFRFRRYDLAVLPRWDFDDTPVRYLAMASRARSIVGFAPVPEREPVWFGDQAQLMTDIIPRGDKALLSVQQLERVADRLGVVWYRPTEPVGTELFDANDLRAAAALAALSQTSSVVVGVGIGARNAKRQWPVEEVAETMAGLSENGSLTVLVLGGDVDTTRARELVGLLQARGISARDLTGRLSLSQSAAAISLCGLFLGNDSGLQHIASSLDIPSLVVSCHPASGSPWSDNAPERFGPWSTRSALLQPDIPAEGCTDECIANQPHCIRAVHATDAVIAARHLLQGSVA